MESFATRFRQLRREMDITQQELCDGFNRRYNRNYTITSISAYENGKSMPEISTLKDFAVYFGVTMDYLLGEVDVKTGTHYKFQANLATGNSLSASSKIVPGAVPSGPTVDIPIIGRVPCGRLDIREDANLGYLTMAVKELRGISLDGLYDLIADGESLSGDGIHYGYNLLFNENLKDVINGKVYIVRYDGQVSAKHVYVDDDCITLKSSNPAYADITLPIEDDNDMPVEIIGRVVKCVNAFDM